MLASSLVATRDSTEELCASPGIRPHRSDRSAGKGRRRRAAAEQRRTDLEHWDRRTHDSEEEIYVAPRPISRRQSRRAARHLAREELDCPLFDGYGEETDLDVALAISLSLSDSGHNVNGINPSINVARSTEGLLDMSYENLVLLENVKCTASPALVSTLMGYNFDKIKHTSSSENVDELCAICQNEFEIGDSLMLLPCMHNLHDVCGSEWLLNHSKLCPVCKHDVTEKN